MILWQLLNSYLNNKKFRGVGDINIQKISEKIGFSYPSYRGGDMIIEQQVAILSFRGIKL